MMHGFQQIITEAECRYNFVVHGLPPRGDEMAVSPLSWRKKLMDSISGNLGYCKNLLESFVVLINILQAPWLTPFVSYRPLKIYQVVQDTSLMDPQF